MKYYIIFGVTALASIQSLAEETQPKYPILEESKLTVKIAEFGDNQQEESFGFRKYISIELLSLSRLTPNFNFGFRKQNESTGYDLGASFLSNLDVTLVRGYSSLLFLPEEVIKSHFYGGIGTTAGGLFIKDTNTRGFFGSGLFSVGRNFIHHNENPKFFQLDVAWPTLFSGVTIIDSEAMVRGTVISWKNPLVSLFLGIIF